MRTRAERGRDITDTVSSSVPVPRRQIAMLSWDGESVQALALMSRIRSTLSFKTNFRLSDFQEVDAVRLESLASALASAHAQGLEAVRSRGGALSSETAIALKELFDDGEQGPWATLEAMVAADPAGLWPEDRAPVVAYEREAVGFALSAAGLDRGEVLKTWNGDAEAPFLTSLAAFRSLEAAIIAHDARVFGGWTEIAHGLIGATRFEQRERKLTVLNVNASKIERTLGCDLIYYTHRYDAYVLVQYKRLRQGGKDWEYRPDKQLAKELERMRSITDAATPSQEPREHRFGNDFCFLKLCRPEVEDPFSREMAEGMYLPLGLWDKLEASGQLCGPKGGTVLNYENVDRYLTNTHIIGLVERSWVGSCGATSKQIGEVIKRALAAGNSLILAADDNERPTPRRSFRRR